MVQVKRLTLAELNYRKYILYVVCHTASVHFLASSLIPDGVLQELEALAGKHLNSFVMVVKLVQWIFLVWAALFSIVSLKASIRLVSTMNGIRTL